MCCVMIVKLAGGSRLLYVPLEDVETRIQPDFECLWHTVQCWQSKSLTITNRLGERNASHHIYLLFQSIYPPWSVGFSTVSDFADRPQIPSALCCGQGLGSPSCLWTTPTWPKSSAAAILWGTNILTWTRTLISIDINGFCLDIVNHSVRVIYVNTC